LLFGALCVSVFGVVAAALSLFFEPSALFFVTGLPSNAIFALQLCRWKKNALGLASFLYVGNSARIEAAKGRKT
jgi:hypothetical protein